MSDFDAFEFLKQASEALNRPTPNDYGERERRRQLQALLADESDRPVRQSPRSSLKLHPALLNADQPGGVNSVAILQLHRAGDSVVSFHREHEGQWQKLFSIPAGELGEMLPEIRQHLTADSYFSINGFWRGERWPSRVDRRFPAATQAACLLRYLNACFVDIDCYTAGLTDTQVIIEVLQMQDNGTIPPASLISRSGRGVWLFWFLDDVKSPERPPRAFTEKLLPYHAIQRALAERFARLGVDAGAGDATRVTRVPGSVNTKAPGKRVSYWLQHDESGRVFTYTMADLQMFLGVSIKRTRAVESELSDIDDVTRANKRRGWKAMHQRRLKQFELLREIRGGFKQGHRSRAALLYARILAAMGKMDHDIRVELEQLASECTPRLSASEITKALAEGRKARCFSDAKIADWLDITPAESEKLQGWPAATRYRGLPPPAPATRDERIALRRQAIRNIIGIGAVPSVRTMIDLLKGQANIEASIGTVHGDYHALRIATPAPMKMPTVDLQMNLADTVSATA